MVFIKMKKNFAVALLISIIPSLCFGASARYTQLVREKQRKYDELQKCLGTTNGLKIAGVSTLGLTAVGVSTNIAQSETKKSYDKKLERADEKLNNIKKQIDNKDTNTDKNAGLTIKQAVENDIKYIKNSDAKPGSTLVLNGYQYKNLPVELSIQVKDAVDGWVKRCEAWEGRDGIQTVEPYNGATDRTLSTLTADNETTNETDPIAECKLATEGGCIESYTQNGNACVAITNTSAQTNTITDNTAEEKVVETQEKGDDDNAEEEEVVETQDEDNDDNAEENSPSEEGNEVKFNPDDPDKSLNDIEGKLIDLDNPSNDEK